MNCLPFIKFVRLPPSNFCTSYTVLSVKKVIDVYMQLVLIITWQWMHNEVVSNSSESYKLPATLWNKICVIHLFHMPLIFHLAIFGHL